MELGAPLLLLAAVVASPQRARGQVLQAKHLEAQLVAENETIRPNEPFVVALRLKMEQGWHTYWRNPGDAGMATSIEWQLPEGFQAGPILWPIPERLGEAPEVSYGYGDEVLLLTKITPPGNISDGREISITANVSWLVCKDLCIPGKGTLTLKLPVTSSQPKLAVPWRDAFAQTWRSLPALSDAWRAQALLREDTIHIYLKPVGKGTTTFPGDLYFFPANPEVTDHSAPQRVTVTGEGIEIAVPRSQYASSPAALLRGIVVAPEPWINGSRALWVDVALPSSNDPR